MYVKNNYFKITIFNSNENAIENKTEPQTEICIVFISIFHCMCCITGSTTRYIIDLISNLATDEPFSQLYIEKTKEHILQC